MSNGVNPLNHKTSDRSRTRRPLTRDRILKAALTLVDQEGPSALTMRRLASNLDSGAMSLYHYVPDRKSLLDGLGEILVCQVHVSATAGDWDDALREFMRGIRAVALAHPHAFQLVGMRPLDTPAALRPIEALLRRGTQEGRDPARTFYAYRAATAFARGFALAEILGFTLEVGSGANATAADVDGKRFPHIARAVTEPATLDHDAAFERGLEAIVEGLSGRPGAV